MSKAPVNKKLPFLQKKTDFGVGRESMHCVNFDVIRFLFTNKSGLHGRHTIFHQTGNKENLRYRLLI